jgi:hypothetical protein
MGDAIKWRVGWNGSIKSQTASGGGASEVKGANSIYIQRCNYFLAARTRHKSDFVNKYYGRVYAESWAALQKGSDASLSQTE